MSLELTILMPCLNEAETIATCIRKAKQFLQQHHITGEVLIADNGSRDGSQKIASDLGARIVEIQEKGYGAALLGGINAASGRYIIMGDSDDSYDFTHLEEFVAKLREGYDLVMGNRFRGGILPGAMPPLHRYFGNPVLTGIGRLFFGGPIRDFHCGLRGFNRQSIQQLGLQTTGMEFASEMIVKARLYNLKITEVPTTLSPDGRNRPPHLRSWRDGWRHLRFLLIYSPRWLFLYPGLVMAGIGLAVMLWLLPGTRHVLGLNLDIHTLLVASGLILLGLQTTMFAVFTKRFGINLRLLPSDSVFDKLISFFSLERGLMLGLFLVLIGMGGGVIAFMHWQADAFGPQQPRELMRIVIPSTTAILAGMEIIFGSFFLSVLGLRHSPPKSINKTND